MSSATHPSPPPDFRVDVALTPGRALLRLVGELSLESVPLVEEPLDRVLEEGSGEIVMDLREVTFLDSSGVRLLLSAEARSAHSERMFAIVLGEGQPARTLELMGLVDRPRRLDPQELA